MFNKFIPRQFSKSCLIPILSAVLIMAVNPSLLLAGTATLTWDAPSTNTDGSVLTDLSGYKVYYGTASRNYNQQVNAGNVTSKTLTLADGATYYFSVVAYDTSGNESNFSNEVSKNLPSTSDITPPQISGISAKNITGSGATVSWITNEASTSQIEYGDSASYGKFTSADTSLVTVHTVSLSGLSSFTTYNFRVRSKDVAGNEAISGNYTFSTSNIAPKILTFSATPLKGTLPLTASFTSSASDSDGSIVNYEWDLDGDGEYGRVTGTSSSTTFTYTAPGTYNARLKVTDNSGTSVISSPITISVSSSTNQPPAIESMIADLREGPGPLKVTFNLSANDPDGTIVKYEWDFDGNGTIDEATNNASLSFVYTNPGTYTARVKATDNSGATALSEIDILVTDTSFPQQTTDSNTGTSTSPSSGGGCFIATAAYGSYLDPHVLVLREFRDKYLLTNAPGKAFVAFYYRISPPVADFIASHEGLRTATRVALTPIIFSVKYGKNIGAILMIGLIVTFRRRLRTQESNL